MIPVIYTLPNCVQCDATKRRFKLKEIDFQEIDLSTDEVARDLVKEWGFASAPVVSAGEKRWSGYRPDLIDTVLENA